MEAFEGIKVADFSWSIVGPATARYLGDHGATVVRVESPQYPDILRVTPPFKDNIEGVERGSFFSNYNVNKYGITLDLSKAEAIELAKRLIAWADIFLESFTPGVVKRWGLDYDSVKNLNTGLIYVSTSMMGQTGPYCSYTGFGVQAAAMAGFDDITGWPDRSPAGVFGSYTDIVAPHSLIAAILVALIQRRKTGKGQYIEQSQLEAGLQFLTSALMDYAVNGRVANRDGNRDPYAAPHGAYRCAGEDKWCVIAVFTDEEWQGLCRIIDQPMWIEDPRFATLMGRKENEDELNQWIEAWTSKFPAEAIMSMLQQAGVPAGVVETAEDMHQDPQFKYRNHFWVSVSPAIGPHTVDAPGFRLSKTAARLRFTAPSLGEHNWHVCTEILGISEEEFVRLMEAGVFG